MFRLDATTLVFSLAVHRLKVGAMQPYGEGQASQQNNYFGYEGPSHPNLDLTIGAMSQLNTFSTEWHPSIPSELLGDEATSSVAGHWDRTADIDTSGTLESIVYPFIESNETIEDCATAAGTVQNAGHIDHIQPVDNTDRVEAHAAGFSGGDPYTQWTWDAILEQEEFDDFGSYESLTENEEHTQSDEADQSNVILPRGRKGHRERVTQFWKDQPRYTKTNVLDKYMSLTRLPYETARTRLRSRLNAAILEELMSDVKEQEDHAVRRLDFTRGVDKTFTGTERLKLRQVMVEELGCNPKTTSSILSLGSKAIPEITKRYYETNGISNDQDYLTIATFLKHHFDELHRSRAKESSRRRAIIKKEAKRQTDAA